MNGNADKIKHYPGPCWLNNTASCLPWLPAQVLTKDSVTVCVDGVVYYRVQNATLAVANITNADAATRLLAQTTLRNVLGTKNLAEILSDREEIAHNMQVLQGWIRAIIYIYIQGYVSKTKS